MKKACSGQVGLNVLEAAELVDEEAAEALDDAVDEDEAEAVDAVVEAEVVDAVVAGTVAAGVLTTGAADAAGALLLAVGCEVCPD